MGKLIFAGILSLAAAASAQTPEAVAKQVYPDYSAQNRCYRVALPDQGDYCVKPRKREIRNTAEGRLMYWLFTGNHFDFSRNEEDGSHPDSGFAGLLVLKETGKDDWQLLAAKPRERAGAWGNAPVKWTFHEFGKDKWGYLTTEGNVHHGFSGSGYLLLHHNGGKHTGTSRFGASYDNTGHYGDKCEELAANPKQRRNCLQNILSVLDSSIKILRGSGTGFYPIRITVNGFNGRKTYKNHPYIIRFDPKKGSYAEPRNYIFDRDY